jgi:hypothetical protein
MYKDIDADFGHWFAGFTDGEGYFGITRIGKSYRCIFSLHLRGDDRPILDDIRDNLEIGDVCDLRPYGQRCFNPTSRFDVVRKAEVIRLRDIFTAYPLRSKKAKDFTTWSKAVDEWMTHSNRWDNVSWDSMISLKSELEECRKFT